MGEVESMFVQLILEGEAGERSKLPGVGVYYDASFHLSNGSLC
jgi:hypothetical protein